MTAQPFDAAGFLAADSGPASRIATARMMDERPARSKAGSAATAIEVEGSASRAAVAGATADDASATEG